MPVVEISGVATVDFPDSMSGEEIKATIKRKFYAQKATVPTRPVPFVPDTSSNLPKRELPPYKEQKDTTDYAGESLLGDLPEIPSGADTTAPTITIPLSAAAKTVRSAVQFATSPKGIAQIAGAATPAAPAIYAKWAYDMLKGGVESVKDAGEAVANLIKGHINRQMAKQLGEQAPPVDQEEVQRLADDAVNTAVGIIGGATAAGGAVHPLIKRTAEVAPLTADALQKETAQAEKGPDAIHETTGTVLSPLRTQPEQGVQQVPVAPSVEKTSARSPQVSPEKSQAVADYERYQEVQAEIKRAFKAGDQEAFGKAFKENEDIKNRYGGMPPPKPTPTVSETTPPVPPEEMPQSPTQTGLRPAIRLVGGEVVVGDAGKTHPDIIAEKNLKAEEIDQRGFVDEQGVFHDREQAAAKTGLSTEKEQGRLHSTDLPEAKEAIPLSIAMDELKSRGWNPKWPFVPADLENKSFRDAIRSDPSLSDEEKSKILSFAPGAPNEIRLEVKTPPAVEPATMTGAAHISEIPETGVGAEKYGVAERVREERAKAGQVEPVEPGEGVSTLETIKRGRAMLQADPNLAERLMSQFEADPQKALSADAMAVSRAKGEALAAKARTVEEKSGTDSDEYRAAKAELSAWDKRSKAMQTEWHKTGMAQQGETDIDTGSFTGLERARRETTGKDFTESQKPRAKKIAAENKGAQEAVDQASEKLNQRIQKKSIPDAEKRASDVANKTVREASVRAAQAENKARVAAQELKNATEQVQRDAERRASDAANKTVREASIRAAQAENKARVAAQALKNAVEQVQRDAEQRAADAANKTVREASVRAAHAENRARVEQAKRDKQVADVQQKAAQRAFDAANKTVREAAVRTAKAENKARIAAAAREKRFAEAERRAAQKALDRAHKMVRDAAIKDAREARRRQADPSIAVWELAKKYLDENKGLYGFDDLRHQIATDLGMKPSQVTYWLARDATTKALADDLWIKQRNARRLKEQAKLWLKSLDNPAYLAAMATIPRAMFALSVFGHGFVALGTHAPIVAFQPRFWNAYVRNFGKMYKMVFSPAYYESQMADLVRRPNYERARRAGLQNDPFQYEEFQTSMVRDLVKDWVGEKNMDRVDKFASAGNRGYGVLKLLRQDMFDQKYGKLPDMVRLQKGVTAAMSDDINHATGVTKAGAPKGSNLLLFAPRLAGSRVMWVAGDPIRAARTIADWKNATTAERQFAIDQVKEKAWVFGTFASLLAANQGLLTAAGSNQKINGIPESLGGAGFDPLAGDFMKFKALGGNIAYGGALLTLAKLPARVATAILYEGKGSKYVLEDERVDKVIGSYIRSQMSPFAGTVTDLALGRDYEARPLPAKMFGLAEQTGAVPKRLQAIGVDEPYNWAEFAATKLPIPVAEGIKEGLRGSGMSDEQAKYWMKAMAITSLMTATGTRITEDTRDEQ